MSWEIVSDAEKPKVFAAIREGRCVVCYGAISADCAGSHELYCCACDDSDDCPNPDWAVNQ